MKARAQAPIRPLAESSSALKRWDGGVSCFSSGQRPAVSF
jgi:hypothetical protein